MRLRRVSASVRLVGAHATAAAAVRARVPARPVIVRLAVKGLVEVVAAAAACLALETTSVWTMAAVAAHLAMSRGLGVPACVVSNLLRTHRVRVMRQSRLLHVALQEKASKVSSDMRRDISQGGAKY